MTITDQSPLVYYAEDMDSQQVESFRTYLQRHTTRPVVVTNIPVTEVGPGAFSITQSLDGFTVTLSAPTIGDLLKLHDDYAKHGGKR